MLAFHEILTSPDEELRLVLLSSGHLARMEFQA